jgi:methionine synthase II (cobalamin-independent)
VRAWASPSARAPPNIPPSSWLGSARMSLKQPPIRPIDVGSFPLEDVDIERYCRGAVAVEDNQSSSDAAYFIQAHNDVFRKKLRALDPATSVLCYVQSAYRRDMISQFLDPILRKGTGLQKVHDAYVWNGGTVRLRSDEARIAEVVALQQGAKEFCEEFSVERIKYKVCVTGPFELMTQLWFAMRVKTQYTEPLINDLTNIVQGFAKGAVVETKYLEAEVLTMDEPSIGVTGLEEVFVDAPSDSKLAHLISCWNRIYDSIPRTRFKGLHLHASPYHEIFHAHWNLLEAHVGLTVKKQWLQEHDKFLRAAILQTQGPVIPDNADARDAWNRIKAGDYQQYLEPRAQIAKTLRECIDRYGIERIPFAGPECGLGSWDWRHGQAMALESLSRVAEVVKASNPPGCRTNRPAGASRPARHSKQ